MTKSDPPCICGHTKDAHAGIVEFKLYPLDLKNGECLAEVDAPKGRHVKIDEKKVNALTSHYARRVKSGYRAAYPDDKGSAKKGTTVGDGECMDTAKDTLERHGMKGAHQVANHIASRALLEFYSKRTCKHICGCKKYSPAPEEAK